MRVLKILIGCLVVSVSLGVADRGLASELPNVLLITADDLGPQLSCYGDEIANTPEIDRLAKRCVQFTTAYVAQASCSPSRSAMLTGLYPHANGQYGLLNADVGFRVHEQHLESLLPNQLKTRGYRTGIIGKLHVGPEKAFKFDMRSGEGFGGRDVRRQVELAEKFINADQEKPWFLMFNLFDPHVARVRQPNGRRGPQFFPDQVKGLPERVINANDIKPWPWQQIDTPRQRKKIAGYYNCVHRIDHAIGLLQDVLDDVNAWENTLIIFLGDHGPPFTRGKTSCYEAGLRVPFLVRWPGVSEPHVSEKLVSSVDIVPTIADAVGIESPPKAHGKSLRHILNTESSSESWRRTLVGEFHYHGASPFFPRRAITDGRYKLIHNLRADEISATASVDGDSAYQDSQRLPEGHPARTAMERLAHPPQWELYDLKSDPIEFVNLADQASYESIRDKLKRALATWQEETEDPFSDPEFRREVEAKYKRGN